MIFVALDSYNAEKLKDRLFALYFILAILSTLVGLHGEGKSREQWSLNHTNPSGMIPRDFSMG